ncbi:MAG: UvrD-helicase domain-containing protein, partial [Wohlfahrtiimonas sp.]
MKIISPISSILTGKTLIEASAGTGKTYTITSLFIRYLLGINLPEPLKLNDILIVTFTKAATAELRIRIYDRILEVQQAFKTEQSNDDFINDILSLIPKSEYIKARSILNEAERLMSDANIFTIHSFCQRFLSQNPLDSQLPFDAKLATSDFELKTEAAKQFWREVCYYFSDRLAPIAYPIYNNPNHVQSQIAPFLSSAESLNAPQSIEDLETAVFDCQGEDGELDHNKIQAILWAFATQQFHHIFLTLKQKNNTLFFDDLIKETEKLIDNATPEQLDKIRDRYKIAMIDEFQDTDNIQYKIFSELFGNTEDRSLLMIGDPKQSIYKFRGADIHTYLNAKHSAEHQYSLGTNYRSSAAVVKGVNELFEQNSNPFLAEDIPFQSVTTPEQANLNYLTINQAQQKGVGIAYLAGDNNKGKFQKASAEYITQRIQQLLVEGKIHHNNIERAIEHQDITILVRGKGDADALLRALKNAKLPAVYLSDKSKVFKSKAAGLIHLFLKSLLDTRNQELMKQTFASLLYQLSLNELHHLLEDHQQYEDFLIEREQCLQNWDKIGIIPMMDQFLHRHHRIHRFRNHADFDRIMTDLRHLCELLQAQSLLSPTKEALVEWLTQQIHSPDDSEDELGGGSNSLRLESEMNVITIMTIHGSKGLEFPITFIPSNFEAKTEKPPFIVQSEDGTKTIDYNKNEVCEQLSFQNEQAENMRLLYVALTRAKYYCEFALSENFLFGNSKTSMNDKVIFSTLLNTETNEPFSFERLQKLQHVQILPMNEQAQVDYNTKPELDDQLTAATFTGKINRAWNISSFTQLTKDAPHSYFMQENQDETNVEEIIVESTAEPIPSIFTFPKGAHTGTFMHELFEKHKPQDLLNKEYLTNILSRTFFSEEVSNNLDIWVDVVLTWLTDIFKNELLPNLTFAESLQTNALHELEFLFPVKQPFTAQKFNQYLQNYRGSETLPQLSFFTLQGMMKGF